VISYSFSVLLSEILLIFLNNASKYMIIIVIILTFNILIFNNLIKFRSFVSKKKYIYMCNIYYILNFINSRSIYLNNLYNRYSRGNHIISWSHIVHCISKLIECKFHGDNLKDICTCIYNDKLRPHIISSRIK